MKERWLGAAVFFACASGVTGCAQLDELTPNQCGNKIVEEAHSEECDTLNVTLDGSVTVRKATDENDVYECSSECRVLCKLSPPYCPDGWGCGTDGVCRRPMESFTPAEVPIAENVRSLLVADIDGDSQKELVVDTGADLRVHYFDETASVIETTSIAATSASPAVGHFVDVEGPDDLAYNLEVAFAVRMGSADRSLAAIPFPLTLPNNPEHDFRVKSGERLVGVNAFGINAGQFKLRELLRVDAETITTLLADSAIKTALPATIAKVGTNNLFEPDAEIPAGRLNEDPPACDQIVVGNVTSKRLEVYAVCDLSGGATIWNQASAPAVAITLPTNMNVAGPVAILDLDGDGHLDVAAYVKSNIGGAAQVVVAYGNGKGHFSSTPGGPLDEHADAHLCLSSADVGTNSNDPYLKKCLTDPPLAFGDFDGDHRLDLVSYCGVFLTTGATEPACGKQTMIPAVSSNFGLAGAEWTTARVVDLNADGRPDVVAASCKDTSISFYEGTGAGLFNGFQIPTTGGVNRLEIGDFDGDLVPDALFTERVAPLVCTESSVDSSTEVIGVVFGSASGGPEGPYELAEVDAVRQVVAANLTSPAGQFDLITDLAVITHSDTDVDAERFTIFQGASDREIIAPYYLVAPDTTKENLPWLLTMGRFTNAPEAGVALLAFERKDISGQKPGNRARLWIFGSQGTDVSTEALISLDQLGDPAGFLFEPNKGAWLGSTDLGGPIGDELLGLVVNEQSARLIVFAHTSGSWQSSQADTITLPGIYRGPLSFADIDGDGNQDIVLTSPADGVVVLWGSGSGTLDHDAEGVPSAFTQIKADQFGDECGASEAFVGAVPLRASLGPGLSLGIVTAAHAYLAKPDESGRGFTVSCLREIIPDDSFAGASLAAGDVDGDGLSDLIIGRPGNVQIFRAQAVVP